MNFIFWSFFSSSPICIEVVSSSHHRDWWKGAKKRDPKRNEMNSKAPHQQPQISCVCWSSSLMCEKIKSLNGWVDCVIYEVDHTWSEWHTLYGCFYFWRSNFIKFILHHPSSYASSQRYETNLSRQWLIQTGARVMKSLNIQHITSHSLFAKRKAATTSWEKLGEKHRKVHFEHSSLLFCYLLFFAQNHRRMSMLFIVRVERHKQIQIFSKHQLRFSHSHRHGEPLLCYDKPEITFLKFSLLSRSMFEQRKRENEQNEQILFHHHLFCELHDELQKSSSHVNFATRTRWKRASNLYCIFQLFHY